MKIQNGVRYQAIIINLMILIYFKITIIKMIMKISIITKKIQNLVTKQEIVIAIKVNTGNQFKNQI